MSQENHAPTSRSKPPPPGEEDAAKLKLGEFQDVDTLTLSEASLVINALIAKRRKDAKGRPINETDVLIKTLEYLDAFARFKQKENVEAVERLLSAHKELTKFERAQIGTMLSLLVFFCHVCFLHHMQECIEADVKTS